MIREIYTIGFTKKTAQTFFELLKKNKIDDILDIRLNNTSQLSGFAKFPDIEYFLHEICKIGYIHDTEFSPTESTLKRYKSKEIKWNQYVEEFSQTMADRDICNHIQSNYSVEKRICLLCSEAKADQCHRRLVGNKFKEVFNNLDIIHL